MKLVQQHRVINQAPVHLFADDSAKDGSKEHVGSEKSVNDLSKLSFLVISHVAFTGHAQELKNFLIQRANKLMFIGHPFSYAVQKKSVAEYYEKGVLKAKVTAPQIRGPEIFLYLKDFLVTFYFVLKFRIKFNICVGVDPLNAFVGLIFKFLGLAQIDIFYVIDYVPHRFKNVVLNSVYRSLDRLCVYHANYTWNLTSAMADARQKIGISKSNTNQITVPTGTHPLKNEKTNLEANNNAIVFLSHLRKGQGVELLLDAMPEVVREIPSVKLLVIGTGPLETFFKEEVKKRKIAENVVFFGYIENHQEIEEIVAKCRVGIAPYVPDPDSFTWYADPGKPKVYLGCGIPVIITKVPEVAFEISKRRAGIAINYNSQELSDAIKKLLNNDKTYEIYRRNAIKFAHELTWDSIFAEALCRLRNFYGSQCVRIQETYFG
jgi:glycosyltransferase involved in cell wall biosynthesis